jgi:hypothetical protein
MAAPPSNDEASGATVIHLGAHVTEDTTQATTNAGDDALNANCGAPATNASVWFSYTSSTKRDILIDVSHSDYSAGLMVFQGNPTANSLRTCGPGEVGLRVKPGRTYYIMAFSDTDVIGGNLDLTLQNAPTPKVRVHVAKRGVATHGAAKLHGTYFCKNGDFAVVSARVLQRAGRLKIQGEADSGVRCDGARHHWSAKVISPVGTYAAGKAVARVRIFACGVLKCSHIGTKSHGHLAQGPRAHRTATMGHPAVSRLPRPHPTLGFHSRWPTR